MNIKKVLKRPGYYLQLFLAVLHGSCYIFYYRIFNRNIKIDFPFIVYGKVRISGPGKVTIGKKCTVVENVFRGLTIVTLSPDAVVNIGGEGCLLGGLTIRCHLNVEIGNNVMTAVSLVQDSLFVNADNFENISAVNNALLIPEPVIIGDNVWLGGHCYILSGSRIGNDCVLSACTMSHKTEIKNYMLGSGNPLNRPLPIDKILGFRK